MPTFSKFIEGQRASQQLVDTDGYINSRRKPKDTAHTDQHAPLNAPLNAPRWAFCPSFGGASEFKFQPSEAS